MSIREQVIWKQMYAFLSQAKTFFPGTERRDRTSATKGLGQNVPVPGEERHYRFSYTNILTHHTWNHEWVGNGHWLPSTLATHGGDTCYPDSGILTSPVDIIKKWNERSWLWILQRRTPNWCISSNKFRRSNGFADWVGESLVTRQSYNVFIVHERLDPTSYDPIQYSKIIQFLSTFIEWLANDRVNHISFSHCQINEDNSVPQTSQTSVDKKKSFTKLKW